jgi:uncharacterized protein YbjT (DUF2867 family)
MRRFWRQTAIQKLTTWQLNGFMETHSELIAVIGNTGKTGHRVVDRLQQQGRVVRPLGRSTHIPFDWDEPETWEPALRGVGRAYVTFAPDLALAGAPERVEALARVAAASGVGQIVLLSGRGEPEAELAEQKVTEVLPCTKIVRSSFFMQNFSEGAWAQDVQSGVVALPETSVREPFIDLDDLADIVVHALTERVPTPGLYEVTGPQLLTFAEAIEEIAQTSGRSVEYVPVPLDGFVKAANEGGVPAEIVDLLAYLFGEVMDGRNEHVTNTIESVLGRPARTIGAFAADASRAGVWARGDAA